MSDSVMIEVPTTDRMLACCTGIGADGHQANTVSIDERIAGLWFDAHKPPPDEPVLITIVGTPCATPGNLTTITAQKKSGKTAFMSATGAAAISDHGDTLGVKDSIQKRKRFSILTPNKAGWITGKSATQSCAGHNLPSQPSSNPFASRPCQFLNGRPSCITSSDRKRNEAMAFSSP